VVGLPIVPAGPIGLYGACSDALTSPPRPLPFYSNPSVQLGNGLSVYIETIAVGAVVPATPASEQRVSAFLKCGTTALSFIISFYGIT